MFRIGDFSKLTLVSIKALRLYDKKGLLKPAKVDTENGYRYYEVNQLPKLNRILALKAIGFSLAEIKSFLEEELSLKTLSKLLLLKEDELKKEIKSIQQKLLQAKAMLTLISQENEMKYDVVLKKLEAIQTISLRRVIKDYASQKILWKELSQYLKKQGVKKGDYRFSVYYFKKGYKESNVDIEIFYEINEVVKETVEIKMKKLPEIKIAASTLVQGDFSNLKGAYEALLKWIDANQYELCGYGRQVKIKGPWNTKNEEDYLTEILFEVRKKN